MLNLILNLKCVRMLCTTEVLLRVFHFLKIVIAAVYGVLRTSVFHV